MAKKKKQKRPTPPPPPVAKKPPRAATAPEGPTRKDLQRQARAQQDKRDALKRRLATAGLAAAAVAAVGIYIVLDRSRDAELRQALTSGTCKVDTEADQITGGDGHVQNPRYTVNPPAGGNHLPSAASSGVYLDNTVPADGLLVHAQEHGYVVVWYEPGLGDEQAKQLAEFAEQKEPDVIVVERTGLPVPVAATAWGHRLLCQEVELGPLDRFFDEHVGNGPEDVDRT